MSLLRPVKKSSPSAWYPRSPVRSHRPSNGSASVAPGPVYPSIPDGDATWIHPRGPNLADDQGIDGLGGEDRQAERGEVDLIVLPRGAQRRGPGRAGARG